MSRKSNHVFLYLHIRKDNGLIFYVGIGVGKRPYNFKGNQRGWRWKQVYEDAGGCEVKILCENLTWKRACELEILMISFYGREITGEGNLVNFTKGGDGRYGTKKTQEEINKIKDKQRKTYDEYVSQLEEKWGFNLSIDRETFTKEYENGKSLITCECTLHGTFTRRASDLVSNRKQGCYDCMKLQKSNKMKTYSSNRTKTHLENLSKSKRGKNHQTKEYVERLKVEMVGSNNHFAKLTDDDVRFIRKNHKVRDKNYSVVALCKKFNVSKGTIHSVINFTTYTNVV